MCAHATVNARATNANKDTEVPGRPSWIYARTMLVNQVLGKGDTGPSERTGISEGNWTPTLVAFAVGT